jgi:hypothetical protein
VSLIEHKLSLIQSDTADHHRKHYGVTLETWSLTEDQADRLYTSIKLLLNVESAREVKSEK